MPEYALRKSVGPHSAGTRVEWYGKMENGLLVNLSVGANKILLDPLSLSMLVELRPRATVTPLKNRRARRDEKRKALEIIAELWDTKVTTGDANANELV